MFPAAKGEGRWSNPAVQRNVKVIQEMGFHLIGPESGRLACGTQGPGRMTEPDQILTAIEAMAVNSRAR